MRTLSIPKQSHYLELNMQIGKHSLSAVIPVILAPMAGVTDQPFRKLCLRMGATMAVSEMISADLSLASTRKTRWRMNHKGETGLRSVQIVGNDPAKMAAAARMNAERGAGIIDINMGCPAKKICITHKLTA